jgi:fumarate reductase flavoprotein subunit
LDRRTRCLCLVAAVLMVFSVAVGAQTLETDVVVVGGGGAGLAAAVSAADNGASVVLIEKMSFLGGSTMISTGTMFFGGSATELAKGNYFPPYEVAEQIIAAANGRVDERLVRVLASESGATIDWLLGFGIDFVPGAPAGARLVASPFGVAIIQALKKAAEARSVSILLDTRGVVLLTEDNQIKGVQAVNKNGENVDILAKAVVLATGGYGSNREMVGRYRPELKDLPIIPVTGIGSTGDGIIMAQEVGAATVNLDMISPSPTGEVNSRRLVTATLRREEGSAILINEDGNRFANETAGTVAYDILDQLEKQSKKDHVFLVFDKIAVDRIPIVSDYIADGLTVQADTVVELAQKVEVDESALEQTISEYNDRIAKGEADPFGRTLHLRPIANPPYYAIRVQPTLVSTKGGLVINERAQVISEVGTPILNLYAAGEVTGGVHGVSSVGGAQVTDAITFGRIAGRNAAVDAILAK